MVGVQISWLPRSAIVGQRRPQQLAMQIMMSLRRMHSGLNNNMYAKSLRRLSPAVAIIRRKSPSWLGGQDFASSDVPSGTMLMKTRHFSSNIRDSQPKTESLLKDETDHQDDGFKLYQEYIDSLFDQVDCRIPVSWKERLLQISPCNRDITYTLDHTQFMGYDPAGASGGVANALDDERENENEPGVNLETSLWEAIKEGNEGSIVMFEQNGSYFCHGVEAIVVIDEAPEYFTQPDQSARIKILSTQLHHVLDVLTPKEYLIFLVSERNLRDWGDGKKLWEDIFPELISPEFPSSRKPSIHPPRPLIGVFQNGDLYTIVEVYLQGEVQVFPAFTDHQVAAHLARKSARGSVWFILDDPSSPCRPPAIEPLLTGKSEVKLKTVDHEDFLFQCGNSQCFEDQAKLFMISKALEHKESQLVYDKPLNHGDFETVRSHQERAMLPLTTETAKEVGLTEDKRIPSLLDWALPPKLAQEKRYLKEKLREPPPPRVAEALSRLISHSLRSTMPFPKMTATNVLDMVHVLRRSEAQLKDFKTIWDCLKATQALVGMPADFMNSLRVVLEYETGASCEDASTLFEKCKEAADLINGRILVDKSTDKPKSELETENVDAKKAIPESLWQRYEDNPQAEWWRSSKRYNEETTQKYEEVDKARQELVRVVCRDLLCLKADSVEKPPGKKKKKKKNLVKYHSENSILYVSKEPCDAVEQIIYLRASDLKVVSTKTKMYTTENVVAAVERYNSAFITAKTCFENVLRGLCRDLVGEEGLLLVVKQALHSNTILSTVLHHAKRSKELGWTQVKVNHLTEDETMGNLQFNSLWPYWMENQACVSNTLETKELVLLTGCNMSGKSTFMRAVASTALLSMVGFCAPVKNGCMSRFGSLTFSGASSDVPNEKMSAFAKEMNDIAGLLTNRKSNGLAFIDELGRGTSERDGISLALATIEEMNTHSIMGIFCTHYHALHPTLQRESNVVVSCKRLTADEHDFENPFSFQLEDGVCDDSKALLTAKRFGVPDSILHRADYFCKVLEADAGLKLDSDETTSDEIDVERTAT